MSDGLKGLGRGNYGYGYTAAEQRRTGVCCSESYQPSGLSEGKVLLGNGDPLITVIIELVTSLQHFRGFSVSG
jgi:hypothetical protein